MNRFIELTGDNKVIEVIYSTFPAGEEYVKIKDTEAVKNSQEIVITVLDASSKTIIQALMLADAVKIINPEVTISGYMPYLPYGRQDRVCSSGESFSLKLFSEMMKLRFDNIYSFDMHSKASEILFDNTPIPRSYISTSTQTIKCLKEFLDFDFLALSPDKGAIRRAQLLTPGRDIAVLNKIRDNGKIIQTTDEKSVRLIENAKNIVISDDICDGGGTFLGAASFIRKFNKDAKLYLVISHAIFSKGIKELLEIFEDVLVVDDDYNMLRLEEIYERGQDDIR